MLSWLSQYLGTIIICLVLVVVFGLLLWSLIRDKKKGKSSCGGCCSSCAMGCHCQAANAAGAAKANDKKADDPHKDKKGALQ